MRYALTLNEQAWAGEGSAAHRGEVVGYHVGGMPVGETGLIARYTVDGAHEWRVCRAKGKETSDYTGHFATPDAALYWLQGQIDGVH